MKFFNFKNPINSTLFFAVFTLLQSSISLLLLPFYLNYISPKEYGIIIMSFAYSNVISTIGPLGLKSALYTFYFDFDKKERLLNYVGNLFTLQFICFFAIIGIHLFLGDIIFSNIFKSNEISFFPYGLMALASTAFTVMNSLYFIFLKNALNLRIFSLYSLLAILLTASLQFVLITELELSIFGFLLGTLIPQVIIFILIYSFNTYIITLSLKEELLYPSVKYSIKLLPFLFFFTFESHVEKYLIESILGLDSVALYTLLIKILGVLIIAINTMDEGIRPFMYRDLKSKKKTLSIYFNMYIGFGILTLAFINAIGYNIQYIFKNTAYYIIKDYFFIGSIAFLLLIPARYYGLVIVYYKDSAKLSYLSLLKVIILIMFMLLLIPVYELYGVLYALIISNTANTLFFAIILRKRVAIFPHVKNLFYIAIFLAASAFMHFNFYATHEFMGSIVYFITLLGSFFLIYLKDSYTVIKPKIK